MLGLDATTGGAIAGAAHLRQSIRDILTTPIGSRVMRRTYGSRIFELVDSPMNPGGAAAIIAAAVEALDTWEPRFRTQRVRVAAAGAGHVSLDIDGEYLPEGVPLSVEGIVV